MHCLDRHRDYEQSRFRTERYDRNGVVQCFGDAALYPCGCQPDQQIACLDREGRHLRCKCLVLGADILGKSFCFEAGEPACWHTLSCRRHRCSNPGRMCGPSRMCRRKPDEVRNALGFHWACCIGERKRSIAIDVPKRRVQPLFLISYEEEGHDIIDGWLRRIESHPGFLTDCPMPLSSRLLAFQKTGRTCAGSPPNAMDAIAMNFPADG